MSGCSTYNATAMRTVFRRFAALLAVLVSAVAGSSAAGCCNRPAIPTDDAFQQVNSPEVTYALLKQAITHDQKNLFYYLLSRDVRGEYPYWMIDQGWSQIQGKLGVDVRQSKLLRVEYLPDNSVPAARGPAARMVVEYPHPEDGRIVESFLLLMEMERNPYGENFPQWRVYYPYGPYQNNVTWFKRLQEQEEGKPKDGDGKTGGTDSQQ